MRNSPMRYNPDRARCSLWRYAQTGPPLDPWPLARTFPGILARLENLAGLGQAGGCLCGQVHLAQRGRVQTGLGRVGFESSRVESSHQSSLADKSVGQDIASSSATDALKWVRHSTATRRPPAPEKALVTGPALASPGRIAGLSNQTPPRLTAPRHAACNWLLSLCRYGLRDSYISQGDTPTLHVSAPRHAQHISQSVTTGPCPIIKPKSIPKWQVVAPRRPSSLALSN